MDKKKQKAVIEDPVLERLKERLIIWRRKKSHGEGIPTGLVEAAKGLVGRYRPGPLAKVLGLHYRRLVEIPLKRRNPSSEGKRRIGRNTRFSVRGRACQNIPRFVKVPFAMPFPPKESTERQEVCVEFENGEGLKARVWTGGSPARLVCDVLFGQRDVAR